MAENENSRLDDKGRLVIEKGLRDKYGNEFVVIDGMDEIVLKPVPKGDPLKRWRELGKKIPRHLSVADLKRMAREQALKEVLDEEKERQELGRRLGKAKK